MYTLNLAYPERGTIDFRKIQFPDGQQDIVILEPESYQEDDVEIISRMNGFPDVELIVAAYSAINEIVIFNHKHLVIPYLLGARSDRVMISGGSHYLRDVVAYVINGLEFDSVEILDAHSDVAEGVINSSTKMDVDFPEWVMEQLLDKYPDVEGNWRLIAPDAGALKKVYEIARKLNYTEDIIVASKHRNVTNGNILSTEVPLSPSHSGKAFVIFDDICDGGRTFIEIAKKIHTIFTNARIFLAVTHSIFSQGFLDLSGQFTHIYTTNSVRDLIPPDEGGNGPLGVRQLVTQLNVF